MDALVRSASRILDVGQTHDVSQDVRGNLLVSAVQRAIEYGTLGHYRSAVRFAMATSQGAASRVWQIRNASTNLIIPTRMYVTVMSAGTVTAAYRGEFSLFKATTFTAVDTTNTVTPTVSRKRTSMATVPGNAAIRHVTVAGAAAGMTGGTLTNDGGALARLTAWLATAAATTFPIERDLLDYKNGDCPLILAENEGLSLENTAAGSATANVVDVSVDFSWAEVAAYPSF